MLKFLVVCIHVSCLSDSVVELTLQHWSFSLYIMLAVFALLLKEGAMRLDLLCFALCLSDCYIMRLLKNLWIVWWHFWRGWALPKQQVTRFWWKSLFRLAIYFVCLSMIWRVGTGLFMSLLIKYWWQFWSGNGTVLGKDLCSPSTSNFIYCIFVTFAWEYASILYSVNVILYKKVTWSLHLV